MPVLLRDNIGAHTYVDEGTMVDTPGRPSIPVRADWGKTLDVPWRRSAASGSPRAPHIVEAPML